MPHENLFSNLENYNLLRFELAKYKYHFTWGVYRVLKLAQSLGRFADKEY